MLAVFQVAGTCCCRSSITFTTILNYDNNLEGIRAYLLRAIFFTYFQSGTTGKLQQMKSNINSFDYEITIEMLDQMNDLRVTDGKIEDVLNSEKGSRVAGEVFTI